MIRVLLVDDHAVMRAGFRMILESEDDIAVVGEAANGTEAVAAASAVSPDVICMDVQMPGMDGIAATRAIVSAESEAAVLIVTTFDRDDYLFEALSAGASGFLLKNAGPEELVHAVRVAAAGDALLAPEVTRRVIRRFAGIDSVPSNRIRLLMVMSCVRRNTPDGTRIARPSASASAARKAALSFVDPLPSAP